MLLGTSTAEEQAGVPIVAQVKATRGSEVKLVDPRTPSTAHSAPSGAGLSATTAQPVGGSKTWDFGVQTPEGAKESRGTVYGPDADQGMLFTDVAKPILQQVLQGYNCTIFAYGQTGTGKTYTMEGDLSPYHGTFHPEAGIIPRTLYSLFDRLVESKSEYSVRCSFIELYNEELRDLNASAPSIPSSASTSSDSTAPPAEPGSAAKTLRIYEETKNGHAGVVIQGLEETVIRSAEEGLSVLRRGSERRQIAATNCNERSSRSHSIFTVNVQVRDTGKEGSEVLRVGKLNLVDLAGSENVGRSGATDSRAREAGMINASLLALGRVINQLVDKSDSNKKQHIAYRESKLTRLLQDSLGGCTKTTIIATISPVSYEETASTLTYAHQAKAIQNRPEINQRVPRSVVLNQFANEIARLQADLQASRGQEGVYVSKETWDSLEAGRRNFDDVRQRLEIAESQLATTRDQFEQNFRLLSTREEQLRRSQEELGDVKAELRRARTELADTKMALAEAEVLRDAYEDSRAGWKEAARNAIGDVDGLRAKLDRKSAVEESNAVAIAEARQAIAARTTAIDEQVQALRDGHGRFVGRLAGQLDAFLQRQRAELASTTELADSHADGLADHFAKLMSTQALAQRDSTAFRALVADVCRRIHRTISAQALSLERLQEEQAHELVQQLGSHEMQVTAALRNLSQPIRRLEQDCVAMIERDRQALASMRAEDADELTAENLRLRALVGELRDLLRAERDEAEAEQNAALERIRLELRSAARRREEALTSTFGHVEEEIADLLAKRTRSVTSRADRLAGVENLQHEVQGRIKDAASQTMGVAQSAESDVSSSIREATQSSRALWQTAHDFRSSQYMLLRAAGSQVRLAEATYERASRQTSASGWQSVRSLLRGTGNALADWRRTADAGNGDGYTTVSQVAAEIDLFDAANEAGILIISQQSGQAQAAAGLDLEERIRRDVATSKTPGPRDHPQDRLSQIVDLDGERPTVLERLLAARAKSGTTASAAPPADDAISASAGEGNPGKRTSRETPSPVIFRVPLPRHERPSLVNASSAKENLKGERIKPAPLGERDHNNPLRRLTTNRRITKPQMQTGT
ncbi:Kinesin-related motor protein [Rhodotorula sphaerocarpa]